MFPNNAFNIAKHPNYHAYERGIASMVCNFFDQKPSTSPIKKELMEHEELAKEFRIPIKRKIKNQNNLIFYRQYLGCWSCTYAIDK